MDLETLRWLRSPPGQALLAELAAQDLAEHALLTTLSQLRTRFPAEFARAAVEQTRLRRQARRKFPYADHMFFTREALEQASSAPVAAQRAARMPRAAHVADLGCGIGGDTLAFAAAGLRVTAVDRDPLRLALAAANVAALGYGGQVTFLQSDLLVDSPPPADVLFCDPGRRAGGRRRFQTAAYEPPLDHVLAWRNDYPALALKLAPGIDHAALAAVPGELEFVALNGELKEARLWCGLPDLVARRATVLQADLGATAPSAVATLSAVAASAPAAALSLPLAFLYEPDPAVIRAGLVTDLAAQLAAYQLDPQIAYLTAPAVIPTPFARVWPIHEWLPFNLKQLQARLRAYDPGSVTVKKRGSPLDPDSLARRLSGRGQRQLVVVLTQVAGRAAALICDPPLHN